MKKGRRFWEPAVGIKETMVRTLLHSSSSIIIKNLQSYKLQVIVFCINRNRFPNNISEIFTSKFSNLQFKTVDSAVLLFVYYLIMEAEVI